LSSGLILAEAIGGAGGPERGHRHTPSPDRLQHVPLTCATRSGQHTGTESSHRPEQGPAIGTDRGTTHQSAVSSMPEIVFAAALPGGRPSCRRS